MRENFLPFYQQYIFYPFQSFRLFVLGVLPFSIGDVLYSAGWLLLVYVVCRWVYYLVKFKKHKRSLGLSALATLNVGLLIYILFFIGWGANYSKPPISESWKLSTSRDRAKDSVALVAFEEFLLNKVNQYAPYYRTLSFKEINRRSISYYRAYTDSKVKAHGLGVKPTLFGDFMEYMAIEGYYNPFTGEGQVNKGLPAFILPFVVCHEMAHQAGIAAEDDANLMAYAVGSRANDPIFNYSVSLNLWIYANNRLYRRDSALANSFADRLNELSAAHIDTLRQLSDKYHNAFTKYTGALYDGYLKMQNQKEGIRSYSNVVLSAWQLELRRTDDSALIHVP
jgi:hypothetical protein